jgi:putative transposase
VAEFITQHRELKDERERQRVVRNGYQPERTIQTGIGDVAVKQPRVRDRAGKIKFSSNILPRYLRRTRSLEELLQWLYLKGVSTNDFATALTALLGPEAPGLSAATIIRLKEVWIMPIFPSRVKQIFGVLRYYSSLNCTFVLSDKLSGAFNYHT